MAHENEATQGDRIADIQEIAEYLGTFTRPRDGMGDLEQLVQLREIVEAAIAYEVGYQRGEHRSWQMIGDALNVTKQAAEQRYGVGR